MEACAAVGGTLIEEFIVNLGCDSGKIHTAL